MSDLSDVCSYTIESSCSSVNSQSNVCHFLPCVGLHLDVKVKSLSEGSV